MRKSISEMQLEELEAFVLERHNERRRIPQLKNVTLGKLAKLWAVPQEKILQTLQRWVDEKKLQE